mgnify:CR=1 FL=1
MSAEHACGHERAENQHCCSGLTYDPKSKECLRTDGQECPPCQNLCKRPDHDQPCCPGLTFNNVKQLCDNDKHCCSGLNEPLTDDQ